MKRYLLLLILFLATLKGYTQKRTYEYDDLNRLSKVYVYNGTTLTHTVTYNYDDMGNRLSKVVSWGTNPSTNMMAHYPFNANSNDESGNNHHLTNTNAVLTTDRHGEANKAYYFNGTSKLISDNVSYLYNTSFSISYWAKPDTYTGLMLIRSGPPATNAALHIAMRSETIYTFAFYGNDYDFTNFKKDNQWHQYIMIYDKEAAVRKIYEDGVLIGSQACNSALFAQNTPLILGYSWDTNYPDHFVGKLDDIRVYNRALTNAEATDIYNQEKPVNTQSIAISNPTSGTFTAGQSVSVSYASTNGSANVSLELVSCAGTTALAVISANAAASGNTNYTLPTSLTAGSYRIKSYVTSAPEQAFYGTCFTVNASSGGDCPPTISHSGTITANTYQASQTIVSTAPVPNNTKYYAGQSSTFLPGFLAERGVNFEAKIQGCATVPTNGLVLHLPFNNNANDVSGNNFNGTASGNVTYAARGTGQSLNVAANAGQYITVPNNATLQNLSSMTLSAWVKPTAFNLGCYTEREMVVGKGKDVSANAFGMSITRNTTPSCGSASSFTTYKMSFEMNGSSIFSDTYSVDNQWKHVICTYDGTSQKLYINGLLVQQQNIGAVNTSNTLPLYVNYATWSGGAFNSNGRFGGGIDEIRIYNRTLTDAEVLQIYNAEKL